MARELNKGKLLIVLKKKSVPITQHSTKYMELFRRADKHMEQSERAYGSDMLTRIRGCESAEEMIADLEQQATKLILQKEETQKELLNEFETFIKAQNSLNLNSHDPVCTWASDKHIHTRYLGLIGHTGDVLLGKLFIIPFLSDKTFREQMEFFSEAVACGAAVEKIVTHTYLTCNAMGIPVPSQVQTMLTSSRIFEDIKGEITAQKCSSEISALAQIPDEELAAELLKLLQPTRWEKHLNNCLERIVVVPAAIPAAPVFSKEHALLAGRLLQEYPDESFSGEFVDNLGEACSWNEGRAVAVVELEYYGIGREDALFILSMEEPEKMVPKHTLMASIIEMQEIGHQEAYYGFRLLSEEQCWDLGEKLGEYSAWMMLMPGNWGDLEKQQASAVLALSVAPPQNREDVLESLEGFEDEILEVLLEAEGDVGKAEQIIEDYKKYSKRFTQPCTAKPVEEKREPCKPAQNVKIKRPHELLVFSPVVENGIASAGISSENVKRMLAYGLRLSSKKASIGGKYFPIEKFRDNSRRVLAGEAGNPDERIKVVEEFLIREGVISTYKQGKFARLNVKKDGGYVEPGELGKNILDSVIGWKVEFDKNTKGNGK